jgi:hypothetical protein
MAGIEATSALSAYVTQNDYSKNTKSKATRETKDAAGTKQTKSANYGKTIGEPQLSEKAQKYYEQLKKKYANYDFILVSEDEKENAKANASKYANSFKTVVLIDEDKIERMATDENYRKQYEGILSGATSQLQQLKSSMENSGTNVKGYGMQVNDNGTASFFAVLKKSSSDQKARIEKKAEQKKAEKKDAEKKAAKKEKEERLEKAQNDKDKSIDSEEKETIIISANSIEELMTKIENYNFTERSNSVQTESEKQIGQNIDFRG